MRRAEMRYKCHVIREDLETILFPIERGMGVGGGTEVGDGGSAPCSSPCHSKCDPWTSIVSVTWKLRNANS